MKLSKLYIPATALLVFGYPMTTVAATLADLPVGAINVFLKGFYAILFLLSLLGYLTRSSATIPIMTAPLLLFFILFGVRLVVDVSVLGIYVHLSSPTYTIAYFFLLTLLPALSVAVSFEPQDMRALNSWIFSILLLSAFMIFVLLRHSGSDLLLALENERQEIREEGDSVARLSAITIGLVGSSLALMSIAKLSLNMGAQGKLRLIISAAGVPLGLGALLLSGSRGPLLAFAVSLCFLVFGIVKTKLVRTDRQDVVSKPSFLLIAGLLIGAGFTLLNADTMFLGLRRLVTTFSELGSEGNTEARIYIAIDALNSVAGSPIFGSSFLALDGTAYAHNSVLEAMMATGVFGGTLFVFSLMIVVAQVWKALTLRRNPLLFPLAPVVISMLVISLFSASISQSPEIWVTVFLFLTVASRNKNEKVTLNRP